MNTPCFSPPQRAPKGSALWTPAPPRGAPKAIGLWTPPSPAGGTGAAIIATISLTGLPKAGQSGRFTSLLFHLWLIKQFFMHTCQPNAGRLFSSLRMVKYVCVPSIRGLFGSKIQFDTKISLFFEKNDIKYLYRIGISFILIL